MNPAEKNAAADALAGMSDGRPPSANPRGGTAPQGINFPLTPSQNVAPFGSTLAAKKTTANYAALEKRRTLIPILLTTGLILFLAGIYVLDSGPESALQDLLPGWAAIGLLIIGALTLTIAALNMLAVRHQVNRPAAPHEAGTH